MRTAAVGIFAVLAFPIGLTGTGRSGRGFLLHAEPFQCGVPGELQQPPLAPHLPLSAPPALHRVLSLHGFVAGSSVGSEARQTPPGPQARAG